MALHQKYSGNLMQTTFIKSLLATAAFVAVSTASAAIITVPTDGTPITMGATLPGTSTWSLGAAFLAIALARLPEEYRTVCTL